MKLTVKVQLKPTPEQEKLLYQTAGSSRFAYNWAKAYSDEYYNIHEKTITEGNLRKEFTKLKKLKGNEWMYNIPNDSFKQAIKDYCIARSNFFKKQSSLPKFKKKLSYSDSFYNDIQKIEIESNRIRLSVIGWIDLCEEDRLLPYKFSTNKGEIICGDPIYNPRITYNGSRWFISISYEIDKFDTILEKGKSIGVDLGLKDFAIVCTRYKKDKKKVGYKYKKYVTKKEDFKKLSSKKKKLDRKVSKRQEEYKKLNKTGGVSVTKSNNYSKLLKKRLKLSNKMSNIQTNYIHQITSSLVKAKPEYIIIEDLNIKGMMKNKHLSKWIGFNQFYKFRTILDYKCELHGIQLIIADRFYPSTQTCSHCGNILTKENKLKLSDREYICPKCDMIMDRDKNAAKNLSKYYKVA